MSVDESHSGMLLNKILDNFVSTIAQRDVTVAQRDVTVPQRVLVYTDDVTIHNDVKF